MADGTDRRSLTEPPEDGAEAAERAFEALRAEVAALRSAVVSLAERGRAAETRPAPDHGPALEAIGRELQVVGTRLAALERKPVPAVTPAAELRGQMAEAVRRELAGSQAELDRTVRALEGVAGRVQSRQEQWQQHGIAAGLGAGLGMLLWCLLVAANPFGLGHGLAAELIAGGRWPAGNMLVYAANPATYDRLWRLYRACPQERATEQCVAAMASQAITPATPASSTAAAPPVTPSGAQGRSGQGR